MSITLHLFFLFPIFLYANCALPDYYWRHYRTGVIPEDAVPGVKDDHGKDTYIGQAYLHNFGLYVAQIFPGKKEVKVANGHVNTTSADVRILCSKHKDKFVWLNTTAATLPRDAAGKHVVVGGQKFVKGDEGLFHIGRTKYNGVMGLGRVDGYKLNEASMHFVFGNKDQSVNNYEVLVYEFPAVYVF